MARAVLLLNDRKAYDDGAILQMRLWAVPAPVPGSRHLLKYSLFYGRPGVRPVASDNASGEGDHVHRGDVETPDAFTSASQPIADFLAEVSALRGGSL